MLSLYIHISVPTTKRPQKLSQNNQGGSWKNWYQPSHALPGGFFGCGSYRMDPKREARERHKRKKELPLRSKGLPPVFLGKKKKIWFAKALPLPFICATSESKACPFTPPGWNTSCDFEMSINLKETSQNQPAAWFFSSKTCYFPPWFSVKKKSPSIRHSTPLKPQSCQLNCLKSRSWEPSTCFQNSYQGDGTRPKTPGYYSCKEWDTVHSGILN